MIFAERALFDPQIEAAKKELQKLAERKRREVVVAKGKIKTTR